MWCHIFFFICVGLMALAWQGWLPYRPDNPLHYRTLPTLTQISPDTYASELLFAAILNASARHCTDFAPINITMQITNGYAFSRRSLLWRFLFSSWLLACRFFNFTPRAMTLFALGSFQRGLHPLE